MKTEKETRKLANSETVKKPAVGNGDVLQKNPKESEEELRILDERLEHHE